MDIETLLCEEIRRELTNLKGLEVGTDDYKATVDVITKLTDRAIDLEKISVDAEEKSKARELDETLKREQLAEQTEGRKQDHDLKCRQLEEQVKCQSAEIDLRKRQLEEERRNRLIANWIAAAGIAIPSVITIWGTLKSFEFEKEGTITTIMGRGFINKLLPKK